MFMTPVFTISKKTGRNQDVPQQVNGSTNCGTSIQWNTSQRSQGMSFQTLERHG